MPNIGLFIGQLYKNTSTSSIILSHTLSLVQNVNSFIGSCKVSFTLSFLFSTQKQPLAQRLGTVAGFYRTPSIMAAFAIR